MCVCVCVCHPCDPTPDLGFGPTTVTLSREDRAQRRTVEKMLRDDCLEEEVNNIYSRYATCVVTMLVVPGVTVEISVVPWGWSHLMSYGDVCMLYN